MKSINVSHKCALMAGLVLFVAAPSAGAPQRALGVTTTGQPSTVTLTGQNASVPGFRSARWGMTIGEVGAALARDFGGARAILVKDPVTGNKALIAPMASLAPGPGPAAISYIFDAASQRLIHVNLDWTNKVPSAASRAAMTDAGANAVAGFAGNYWKLGSVMRGVVVQPDLVVLFAGTDERGGGVDVRLGGVPYALGAGTSARSVTPASGPASLHVGFSAPAAAKADDPLKPGAF